MLNPLKHHEVLNLVGSSKVGLLIVLESKMTKEKCTEMLNRKWRDWNFIENSRGDQKGRIVVLWRPEEYHITELRIEEQLLHCKGVRLTQRKEFYLTAIYAYNSQTDRTSLWSDLWSVKPQGYPWIVGGDFNCILSSTDKMGGTSVSEKETEELKKVMEDCQLKEIKTLGGPLTWNNRQLGNQRVCCKLDRILISEEWLMEFADSYATVIKQGTSDHSPILLNWETGRQEGKKSFKFFNMWTEDPLFEDIVKKVWSTKIKGTKQYQLAQRLKMLKHPLKELNRRNYQDIEVQYNNVRKHLEEAQEKLQVTPFNYELQMMEKKLVEELKLKTKAVMSFWEQKIKMDWCKHGDANTKYFHAAIKERQARNKIRGFQEQDGNLVEDWEAVKLHFIRYFENLLGTEKEVTQSRKEVFARGKKLKLEEQIMLIKDFSEAEIRKAMMDINPNKSPGPDGFGSGFFRSTWEITGNVVTQAAKEFCKTGKLLKQFNTTLISLIPKKENPVNAGEYRPISCCNSFYKCITKVLSNRMSKILPEIVNENQGAFVQGRLLMHNVLLTQELIRLYRRKTVKPSCILKVDLRKAYDTISWQFIKDALQEFQFPARFGEWIWQCISTCTFTLNLNGNGVGFFQGKRGIRQGDPISPLIFVLVMEYLTRLFKEEVDKGNLKFHHLCEKEEVVSLCFADDLILLCEANTETVQRIKEKLDEFGQTTGLIANVSKSQVICVGVTEQQKNRIKQIVGYEYGQFPLKYLGFPVQPGKWGQGECHQLVDRIACRIKSRSARHLSYAGRAQLRNSVLLQMHTFWASVFIILPKSVIVEVTRICRDFLWGTKTSGRAVALVAWQEVCKPRRSGGLGIHNSLCWNEAFIGKQVWDLATKKDNLWVKWMHGVYLKRQDIWNATAPNDSSWHWKQIVRIKDKIKQGVINGYWTQQPGNEYTVRSGYRWLIEQPQNQPVTKFIWNSLSIPKHGFIVWLMWKGRLMTRARMIQLGMSIDNGLCPVCSEELETIDHLFVSCRFAKEIWSEIWKWTGERTTNLKPSRWSSLQYSWKWKSWKRSIMFAIIHAVFYGIWQARNKLIFQGEDVNCQILCRRVKQEVQWRVQDSKRKRSPADDRIICKLFGLN